MYVFRTFYCKSITEIDHIKIITIDCGQIKFINYVIGIPARNFIANDE